MDLLSGNIGGTTFPNMKRGYFYSFSYLNISKESKKPTVINPILIFSAIDENRRIHGLNLRILRNHDIFLEDYTNFYFKNGTMNEMFTPEHPYAFSHRILKALFKRNLDVLDAWKSYIPTFMKNIKDINIEEAKSQLSNDNKVHLNNMGVI